MDFVTELNSAVVVDRTGLQKQKTDAMNQALAGIYQSGKTVIMVDSATAFFSNKNLLKTMEDPESIADFSVILEHHGVQLSAEEFDMLVSYHALKQRIKDIIQSQIPSYPFADVPDDWSAETHLTFLKHSIRRTNDTNYSIGVKILESIWKRASAYWAGHSKNTSIGTIRASGYYREGTILADAVKIGCQQIRRYEIEQVALKLGWAFPEETV